MRKLVVAPLSVAFAALLLAGCGNSGQSNGSSTTAGSTAGTPGAPAPASTAVTGTVSLQNQDIEVTPAAKLELSLVDVTQQPGVTVNTQQFNPPQFPQDFRIPFSPSAINGKDIYVLQATMQDDGRTWTTKLQQPVLTHGQSDNVDITLVAEPTPPEKMLQDFQQAKRQTGAMKVDSGTSSKIGESRSWQVFSNEHGVQFVIVQVNRADKGFTRTEYAYRDELPWVVVEEDMPQPDAKPTSTKRAGWNKEGVLVLKQHVQDGKTSTLADADARALHKQAEAEYKKFAKKR